MCRLSFADEEMSAECQGPPIEGWYGRMLEHREQGLAAHQLAKLACWPDAPRLPTARVLGMRGPRHQAAEGVEAGVPSAAKC